MNFYEAIKNRRTVYSISNKISITEEKIQEIVEYSLKYVPTPFNSQSNRAVVLFKDAHNALWDTIKEALQKVTPPENFAQTERKINSFKNGNGTVLYFEDKDVITQMQKDFPLYADDFPVWSQQSNGMLQFSIWNLLEVEGLAASLQHYNIFVESFLQEKWNIPSNWVLTAQMPFGTQVEAPGEKQFNDISKNIKVIK